MKQPVLTPEQLKIYEGLQRIYMAWAALVCIFGLFTAGFVCFLVAVFQSGADVPKGILGGIDFLLGWALKTIIKNLFPPRAHVS
jgi:hypothetical protein